MTTMYSTLTSKGQITLPAALRRKLGFEPGLRVGIDEVDGGVVVSPIRPMSSVRESARREMIAAGTVGQGVNAATGWQTAAAQKLESR